MMVKVMIMIMTWSSVIEVRRSARPENLETWLSKLLQLAWVSCLNKMMDDHHHS